jgi:hypothetical protein
MAGLQAIPWRSTSCADADDAPTARSRENTHSGQTDGPFGGDLIGSRAGFRETPRRLSGCRIGHSARAGLSGSLTHSSRQEGRTVPNDHNAEPGHALTEEHRNSAEVARTEAEHFRRLAEEAREVRDQHREALEIVRQERENLREAAEAARIAGEDARAAAEEARHAVVEAVDATAAALQSTLAQMKAMEEMRRALRDIRDVNKLDSN